MISNPVDAMAMVCKKFSRADFVISTGTNLESLRFRSRIAQALSVQVSKVQGWVGGEHGDAAIPLWSTTIISGKKVDDYSAVTKKILQKAEIEGYVKSVSKLILDCIGATEYGPAASFRDITRTIVKDTKEVLPIAASMKFKEVSEPTFVGVPTHLGKTIGSSLYEGLSEEEKRRIVEAAKAIHQTYRLAIESVE